MDMQNEIENTGADDAVVSENSEGTGEGTENNGAAAASGAQTDAEKEAAALLAEETDPSEVDPAGNPVASEGFKPNVKIKVLDKEIDIPKDFHSLMKDDKSEKMVRELFEKAEGLPIVKQKLETVRSENTNLSKRLNVFDTQVAELSSIYQDALKTGNLHKLDDWFKAFEMPTEVVINYAIAKAKFAELPPEQQQMIRGQLDAERNAKMQQQQVAQTQQNLQKMTAETKTLQFESAMQSPSYKSAETAYDAQVGKPGAFKEAVRRIGQLAWYTEKVDLTPQQAIDRAIEYHGLKAHADKGATPAPVAAAGASGQQATVVVKKPAATIPNFGSGSSKSPVSTGKPRSMDDLKKLRDEAWGKSS